MRQLRTQLKYLTSLLQPKANINSKNVSKHSVSKQQQERQNSRQTNRRIVINGQQATNQRGAIAAQIDAQSNVVQGSKNMKTVT